ncbi:hypothetical protein HU200_035321 [Digitaria exilis]|uniref:Uncharacterized protein n=1 Tax=Digitaria exilis TaxID=1010633 RepID=A0A835BFZ2_9POAL|nr:hypothetical protein HU200_035321 [Digitaria exilis]
MEMEQATSMKRRFSEPDGPRTETKHLYLIFDDYPWGYSIREINLSPPSTHQKTSAGGKGAGRVLPPPVICFEAPRGRPWFFSAVGTKIMAMHRRHSFDDSMPDGFLPIVDVRWRGFTFGPLQIIQDLPIYVPVGEELFSLDVCSFRKLSLKPLWPPRLEIGDRSDAGWSWCNLPDPSFGREDVTSYAVHPDGRTILFSTESDAAEPTLASDGQTVIFSTEISPTTFTFDMRSLVWKRHGEWTLPFTGRAFFVQCLQNFVGLSKDPDTFGHLCSCDAADTDSTPAWKVSKEKLFSEEPDETHVGATLIHMGEGSEFCLLQCVSIEQGNGADQQLKEVQLKEDGEIPRCCSYLYRLTTFCLSFDDNGDLTTGGTCQVQYYKVPEETTEAFLGTDPVAFWL